MKYVSFVRTSRGLIAVMIPDSPPMTNIFKNASAKSIGVVNWTLPPHKVPSQLKTMMKLGKAISIAATVTVRRWDVGANARCPPINNVNPAILPMQQMIVP